MSHSTSARKRPSPRADKPDPFRFGWRYVQEIGRDGGKVSKQVPLTLDDVLHPQEGDHIPDNTQQEHDCTYLTTVLRYRVVDTPSIVVLNDCLINWGIRGLRNHSPDVSVFENVSNPNRHWRTFSVLKENARPVLAVEIVSPDGHDRQARDNDVVTKVREYYRAKVPLYVLVDQERVDGPRRIVGYRRGTRKYVPMAQDERGRLLLEALRLRIGLRDERVVCWDADTDEEIGDLTQAMQARREAEAARREAEAARLAEMQGRREAEAARLAEMQGRREAEAARREAEAARLAEMQARRATESALAAALARVRELEAKAGKHGRSD